MEFDMPKRTCSIDGCDKPHQARGMCGPHYGTWHRKKHGRAAEYYDIVCIMCGKEHRAARKTGRFCSDACKGKHYSLTKTTRCKLPADHPVRLEMARQREAARRARESKAPDYSWRTARECPGCGGVFTPLYTPNAVHCSRRCSRRMERRKRRLSDRHTGWVWSEFMRIAMRFDFCCAYCGVKPKRLDPDHVVPLSRGGADSATNLLPACPTCNSSKCAMSLTEWAEWRARRGLPAVKTTWDLDDARYHHLTHALLAA